MNPEAEDIPVALTIAGTDPSGGAGINVDLQVFRDFGIHGTSAIAAVVWQNTRGVGGWRALEADELRAQADAVAEDFDLDAVKIGMLSTRELIEETADFLESLSEDVSVVLDPVMAGGTGDETLTTSAARASFDLLADRVDLITPNGPEARALVETGAEGFGPEKLVELLIDRGWSRVLLKGGHLHQSTDGEVVDWYGEGDDFGELEAFESVDADVRGTGCQLSSAIAASRAGGSTWREAIDEARSYLHGLLVDDARQIGRGRPLVVRGGDRK